MERGESGVKGKFVDWGAVGGGAYGLVEGGRGEGGGEGE